MSGCEIRKLRDVDFMVVSKLFLFLLILSVFMAPIFVSEALAVNSRDVAGSAIDMAEESLVSAYEAVLGAEQAGANVSGLLARLNVAGKYLANAHIRYSLGDFGNATRFANLTHTRAEEVRNEAVELKNEAYALWVWDLWTSMTVSIAGVISVGFLSFLVWSVFKRHYQKRVLGMKPEVVSGES